MFFEGFYNSSGDAQVIDTAKAYLRNTYLLYSVMDSENAIVTANGNAQFVFSNATNGTYYPVIKHRNSIETCNSTGISVTTGVSSILICQICNHRHVEITLIKSIYFLSNMAFIAVM